MTVLLIPGLLCDGFVWEPLTSRFDAAVADLTTQNSLTDMAYECLAAHPGALRIAGHSMGARVAMEIARIAPERVERMALLDTGAHPLAKGEAARREDIVRFAYDNGMEALAERWLPQMVYAPNRENAALMRGLKAMVLRCDADLHARQIQALVNRPDATAYLSTLNCPTLLVVGRHDAWSPLGQHEEMARQLPDARLTVIEDAGHFAPIEQPRAVCGVLEPFLTGA
ncbi:MAG: alpha/beta fold hydrolase [Maritimibacter sp.]